MTEAERFAIVLDELGSLRNRLDGLCELVLIGGQVLAVEQVAASQDPVLQVETLDARAPLHRPSQRSRRS